MIKHLLSSLLVLLLVAGCAPATSGTVEQQAEGSSAMTGGEDHEDGEHGDEDAGEHEHDEEGHEDEDATAHEDDGEHREHGAHVHGAAELTIAWSGSDMAIDLHTPAYNVLGFEHAPATDAERALLEQSIAALEAGDLLQLDPDADCAVMSAIVESTIAEETHHETHAEEAQGAEEHDAEEHDHAGEDHDEEVHSDIDVAYNLVCQQPDNIQSLDASGLFAQFPNLEEIQVQWVSDNQQSAAELTPVGPVIAFN